MGSLNRFHNTAYGTSASGSNANSFQRLNELRIIGTKTAFDGQEIPLFMFNTEAGKAIKLNYAFPTQTAFNQNLFSNTLVRFDNNAITFDDTNP
jgi:hypothetical protein